MYRSLKPTKHESAADDEDASVNTNPQEPFLVAKSSSQPTQKEHAVSSALQPLHELLSSDGDLLDFDDLTLLALDGTPFAHLEDAISEAEKYTTRFRETLGGCSKTAAQEVRKRLAGKTGDLFCFGGKENEEYDLQDLDLDLLRPEAQNDDYDVADEPRTHKAKDPRPVEELKGRNKADAREQQDQRMKRVGADDSDNIEDDEQDQRNTHSKQNPSKKKPLEHEEESVKKGDEDIDSPKKKPSEHEESVKKENEDIDTPKKKPSKHEESVKKEDEDIDTPKKKAMAVKDETGDKPSRQEASTNAPDSVNPKGKMALEYEKANPVSKRKQVEEDPIVAPRKRMSHMPRVLRI